MIYRYFAVLGSVAVMLALAFDPFMQNLIHYYQNLVVDSKGTAVVSSNSLYNVTGPVYAPGKTPSLVSFRLRKYC